VIIKERAGRAHERLLAGSVRFNAISLYDTAPILHFFYTVGFGFRWILSATLSVLMSGFLASLARAEAGTIDSPSIEETVIVASRTPELLDELGVSVSVLAKEDIRSFGYPDLGPCSTHSLG